MDKIKCDDCRAECEFKEFQNFSYWYCGQCRKEVVPKKPEKKKQEDEYWPFLGYCDFIPCLSKGDRAAINGAMYIAGEEIPYGTAITVNPKDGKVYKIRNNNNIVLDSYINHGGSSTQTIRF
jgi:hypothetical protein